MRYLFISLLILFVVPICSAYEFRDWQGRTLQESTYEAEKNLTDRLERNKEREYQRQMLQQQIEQNKRLEEINNNLEEIERDDRKNERYREYRGY